MAEAAPARWWSVRRSRSRKPATYRCPFCGGHLPAMTDHILIYPEGDTRRRRHAHVSCAMAARRAGRLPTRDQWRRSQPDAGSGWRSLAARLLGRPRPERWPPRRGARRRRTPPRRGRAR